MENALFMLPTVRQGARRAAVACTARAPRALPSHLFSSSAALLEQKSEEQEALLDAAERIAAKSAEVNERTGSPPNEKAVDLSALDRLRPRAVNQRRSAQMSAVGHELRVRRTQWNKAMRDVTASFSLQQLQSLAKQAELPGINHTTSKRTIVPIILEKYFGMKNPTRAEMLGMQQGIQRYLPLTPHELFLVALQHDKLLEQARAAGVKLSLVRSDEEHAIRFTGPQSGVEELLVWLADFKQSICTDVLTHFATVPTAIERLVSNASRCAVRSHAGQTLLSYVHESDMERAKMLLYDYAGTADAPLLHEENEATPLAFAASGALDLFRQARLARAPHERLIGTGMPFELPIVSAEPGWETTQRADFGHVAFARGERQSAVFIPGLPPACLDMSGPLSESVRLTYRADNGVLLEASYDVPTATLTSVSWIRREHHLVTVPYG